MRSSTLANVFILALSVAGILPWALPLPAQAAEGEYRLLELDGYKVKWGEQRLGVGASISYAFAGESLRFDDAQNCRELAPMADLAGHSLSMDALKRETAAAFQVWERAADLVFHEVADARDADIILGAQGQPRAQAFASVTYAPGTEAAVRTIDQALVCLNPDHKWKVGFDGNEDVYDIRYTLVHEIGHAIGLDHPGASGEVMAFRYTEEFNNLQPGDLRGVRELYGRPAGYVGPVSDFDFYPTEQLATANYSNGVVRHSAASNIAGNELDFISDAVLPQYGPLVAIMVNVGEFLGIGK